MVIATVAQGRVRVEVESKIATSDSPTRILVYEDGQLVAETAAEITMYIGADGGLYSCVVFERKL